MSEKACNKEANKIIWTSNFPNLVGLCPEYPLKEPTSWKCFSILKLINPAEHPLKEWECLLSVMKY